MSKRFDLREFQQRVLTKLQDKDLPGAQISTLGVQIAGENWLVNMTDISEVLPLPRLTTVPFAKPWFRGMTNVRGKLYGVTDIAAYRGNGTASGDSNNRILLVAERYAFNAALLVDRVLGMRDTQTWRPNEIDGQTVYCDELGTFWRQLNIPELLAQPEFLQIEAMG